MNCDKVFAILTRGPFPSGDPTDSAVETHLSLCAECRHFADALRPDGSTDAESLVPEESRGLPYYWGLAALPGGEPVGSLTVTEGRRTRRRRKPTFLERHEPLAQLSGWQLAFAVLMGAMLGTLLRLIGYADGSSTNNETIASANHTLNTFESHASAPLNAQQRMAAKFGATPACWERLPGFDADPSGDNSLSFAAQSNNSDLCCTQCHNASAPRFALRATTAKIARSCQICHEETATTWFKQPQRALGSIHDE